MDTPDQLGRLDDAARNFFAQQGISIDETAYTQEFPEFQARSLVPTITGVEPWARAYLWSAITEAGKARLASPNADDVPVVGTSRTQNTSLINKYWLSYIYEDDEIRMAMANGLQLDRDRAIAARRGVDMMIDEVIAGGDTVTGSLGLLNQTGVTTVVASNKVASGLKPWGTMVAPVATGEEVAMDIMGLATDTVAASLGNVRKLTVLMPIQQYSYAAQRKFGNATDITALDYALKSPFIEQIIPWFRTLTAGASSTSRMVAYPRDPRLLGALVPQEYVIDPPIRKIHKEQVIGWAKSGGVIARYPYTIGYMDGI